MPVFAAFCDPGARGLRGAGAAGALVVEDARRDDLVLLAALLLADGELVRAGERDAAHGRDAVRQPQLVGVLDLRVLRRSAGVHVHVDEAGEEIHAGAVDLVIGRLSAAASRARAALALRHAGRAGRRDAGDAIARHRHVHRPAGGAPVPSMTITLRMTIRLNGPRPSPWRRADAATNPPPPAGRPGRRPPWRPCAGGGVWPCACATSTDRRCRRATVQRPIAARTAGDDGSS